MSADIYLNNILTREAVDMGPQSKPRQVQVQIDPVIQKWAGAQLLSIAPSGSFAKGTANSSGTDIDLFISLSENVTNTLKEIYESLFTTMAGAGYSPKRQNVSINVKVNGQDVDLVPAKRQNAFSADHSLYRRRADTWTKTNVLQHIAYVAGSGRLGEIRILKLWRNQKGLDFPSFYLELVTIAAMAGSYGSLSDNVWTIFRYLRDSFENARFVDPANTNNIISDDLSAAERTRIKAAAVQALGASNWNQIVT